MDVIADNTDNRFTRDLMLDAVPYSSANILAIKETCPFGGIISEIIDVPLLKMMVFED